MGEALSGRATPVDASATRQPSPMNAEDSRDLEERKSEAQNASSDVPMEDQQETLGSQVAMATLPTEEDEEEETEDEVDELESSPPPRPRATGERKEPTGGEPPVDSNRSDGLTFAEVDVARAMPPPVPQSPPRLPLRVETPPPPSPSLQLETLFGQPWFPAIAPPPSPRPWLETTPPPPLVQVRTTPPPPAFTPTPPPASPVAPKMDRPGQPKPKSHKRRRERPIQGDTTKRKTWGPAILKPVSPSPPPARNDDDEWEGEAPNQERMESEESEPPRKRRRLTKSPAKRTKDAEGDDLAGTSKSPKNQRLETLRKEKARSKPGKPAAKVRVELVGTNEAELTFDAKVLTAKERDLAAQRKARAEAREERKRLDELAGPATPSPSKPQARTRASVPVASSSKRKLEDDAQAQGKRKRKPRTLKFNALRRRPMLPERPKTDPLHDKQILCRRCFIRGTECEYVGANIGCEECHIGKKRCAKLDPEDPCLDKDEATLRLEALETDLSDARTRLATLEETVRLSEAVIPNLEAALSIILTGGDTDEILRKLERGNYDYEDSDDEEEEETEDPKGKGKARSPNKGEGKGKGGEK